jgi:hypothetical protein
MHLADRSDRLNVVCTSGSIVWGAVKCGSVERYLEEVAGPRPSSTVARPVIESELWSLSSEGDIS